MPVWARHPAAVECNLFTLVRPCSCAWMGVFGGTPGVCQVPHSGIVAAASSVVEALWTKQSSTRVPQTDDCVAVLATGTWLPLRYPPASPPSPHHTTPCDNHISIVLHRTVSCPYGVPTGIAAARPALDAAVVSGSVDIVRSICTAAATLGV
jgi:hypothetical protein